MVYLRYVWQQRRGAPDATIVSVSTLLAMHTSAGMCISALEPVLARSRGWHLCF